MKARPQRSRYIGGCQVNPINEEARFNMIYLGIDYHKKFSFVTAIDENQQAMFRGRVANTEEAFLKLQGALQGPFKAVVEASRTHWVIYDLLTHLGIDTQVAHPNKLRAIAEAHIKTDARDSDILANLLRANLIPAIHIPNPKVRLCRNLMRQRLYLVQTKTRTKNRIHHLLDRNYVPSSGLSDLFGRAGRCYIESQNLPESERVILKNLLEHLDFLDAKLKELDRALSEKMEDNPLVAYIQSTPGIGKILSAYLALEIDTIERFKDSKHFVSYTGLCPSVYASGGYSHTGHLLKASNKLLKWAFIEAAWVGQSRSAYCRAYFVKLKERIGTKSAIVALARRLACIVYSLLKDKRFYEERFFPSCPRRPLSA